LDGSIKLDIEAFNMAVKHLPVIIDSITKSSFRISPGPAASGFLRERINIVTPSSDILMKEDLQS